MSVVQLKLPLRYRCANPNCHDTTYQQHLFCGMACYEAIERANREKPNVRHQAPEGSGRLVAFASRS